MVNSKSLIRAFLGDEPKKERKSCDDVVRTVQRRVLILKQNSTCNKLIWPLFSCGLVVATFLAVNRPAQWDGVRIMIMGELEAPTVGGAVNKGGLELELFNNPNCGGEPDYVKSIDNPKPLYTAGKPIPQSARVIGTNGYVDVLTDSRMAYLGAIMAVEDCVELKYTWFPIDYGKNSSRIHFLFKTDMPTSPKSQPQIPPVLQQNFSTHLGDPSVPHTRFVFSVTSSAYFGYQVFANAASFLQSQQTDSSWTRLLSARITDDLSEHFPTFTAPKSLYQSEYAPVNKPDIIDKWMHSADAPNPEDTIVVIDPDQWLIKDVHNWTTQVSFGNAMGQFAFYHGEELVQQLWQELCWDNCGNQLDMVGVPYIVKAADLKKIAPLWRNYSIAIQEQMKNNPDFVKKYDGLALHWVSEMVGYNMASAHLGIRHKAVQDLHVRDIQTTYKHEEWEHVPIIHMGRAWFPKDKAEEAERWRSEKDDGFNQAIQGIQVWCKKNQTAHFIHPWPVPEGLDFVSSHTLRVLHESSIKFGPVPSNEKFRKDAQPYMSYP